MLRKEDGEVMDEQKLNILLKTRHVPDAPSNLAARIIDESRKAQQGFEAKAGLFAGLRDWIGGFGQGFMVLQPVRVLGAVVLLGGVIGVLGIVNLPVADMPSEEIYDLYAEADGVSLAFYVDDIFEYQ